MSNLDVGTASLTIHPTIIHVLVFTRPARNYHRSSPYKALFALSLAQVLPHHHQRCGKLDVPGQMARKPDAPLLTTRQGYRAIHQGATRPGRCFQQTEAEQVQHKFSSSTYVQHKQTKMHEYNRLDISSTHAQVFKLLHKTWFVRHDTLLHNTWSKLRSWPHKFDQVHKLVRRSSITSATST